jgi:uncharacterized protein
MSESFSHYRRRLGMVVRNSSLQGTALITGASAGIGAIYADRLARRGHDLVLVARNQERLHALATRITKDTGRAVEVIVSDLNEPADLARVEHALRTDTSITMLVNNAGIGSTAPLLDANVDAMVAMIDLNITALVRLTRAVMPSFVKRDSGTIINVGSVVGLAPEILTGAVYGGTKAFVLGFSLSLQKELAESKVRVQAVLPGATATDFWDLSGTPLDQLPSQIVMTAADLVDAALVGLDLGELVTIPALPDLAEWEAYESARQQMITKLSLSSPAERYGVSQRTALQR